MNELRKASKGIRTPRGSSLVA